MSIWDNSYYGFFETIFQTLNPLVNSDNEYRIRLDNSGKNDDSGNYVFLLYEHKIWMFQTI
jgi:hypothetical protein